MTRPFKDLDPAPPSGQVTATGTRAFLHGIFGVGPVKGATLYDLWGEDAMAILLDSPSKIIEAVGSKRTTNTLRKSIRSIGLWHRMFDWFTSPLATDQWMRYAVDDAHVDWSLTVDKMCVMGSRLRLSRYPDRLWDWMDEYGATFHRFEYDIREGEVVCGSYMGRTIYLHDGSWTDRQQCLYGLSIR